MEPLFLRLLDEMERREAQSLTWGYADGSFSSAQVLKLATSILRQENDHRPP